MSKTDAETELYDTVRRLAALIPGGALLADTDPLAMLNAAADLIEQRADVTVKLANALREKMNGPKACGHDFVCICPDDLARAALTAFDEAKISVLPAAPAFRAGRMKLVQHVARGGFYLRSQLKVVDATNGPNDGKQMVLYVPKVPVPGIDAFVREKTQFEEPGRFRHLG